MKDDFPSKIIGIQFSVLSPEQIRKGSVAHIHKRDTYINGKPVVGGLFDPRMGVSDPGLLCPTDGLNYMETPGHFGHIELAKPVYYIQYIQSIIKILRCICIKCGKLKLSKTKHKHVLKMDNKKRWDYVFKAANKIARCGDDTCDGCGTYQPLKIYKEGLANIQAEWKNEDKIADASGKVKDNLVIKLFPEDVLKIFRRMSDEDIEFMGFSPIWSRPEWFICQVLAVPPPAVRPSVKHDAQQRSEDDLSHIIVNIIKSDEQLGKKIKENAEMKIIEDWRTVLQYYIATMVDNNIPGSAPVQQRSGRPLKSVKERLKGKQGRVRGNLMGKRVDFSARSVITPDPNLSIKELGVPIQIAKTITVPQKVNARNIKFMTTLLMNGPDKYPGANILRRKEGDEISLKYVDRNSIKLKPGDVLERHLMNGDPVLFNRQPTLHRMSMMCHIVRIMTQGKTFRMNVADTKPYNADFDGDEMNMHGPQNEEAASELLNLAAIPHQIISPANNKSIVGIFQDSLLSSYRFTRKDIKFDSRHAMNLLMYYDNVDVDFFKKNKGKKSVSNFRLLSQIIPDLSVYMHNGANDPNENKKDTNNIVEIKNGKYIRGQIDKGILGRSSKGLIQRIYNDYGHERATDFIDNLQYLVTEYMKLSGYSVGISDLIADDVTNQKINDTISEKKKEVNGLIQQLHINAFENNSGKSNEVEFETRVNSILNEADNKARKLGKNSLSDDNRFVIMVNAGSKGSNINIAQMISCLGQQNVDNKRIPYGFENRTLPHFKKYDDSPEARGFIENSFIEGLTPQEMYFHAMSGRTGLIDTAVKTSGTGYIQRRLIKGCEDLKLNYDMTVRNNKNKIVQFSYGDDNINPCRAEKHSIKLIEMTDEDLFIHFTVTKDMFGDHIFTKPTMKRFNSEEKKKLKTITKDRIKYMQKSKDDLIKHVFKYNNMDYVHIGVNIERLIYSIKQNKMNKKSMVNITPTEFYSMIDDGYEELSLCGYIEPSELFKIVWTYYLTPVNILFKNRFSKNQLILLLKQIKLAFEKSIMHPGEMVGVIGAQSIGEPTTQLTLNTFHFAGVASKSNVTRGVPRVEEILSTSDNCKNPSVTIYLKEHEEEDMKKAQDILNELEYTSLKDITESSSIYFEPNKNVASNESDQLLLDEFNSFENMVAECNGSNVEGGNSKWVMRLKLSEKRC